MSGGSAPWSIANISQIYRHSPIRRLAAREPVSMDTLALEHRRPFAAALGSIQPSGPASEALRYDRVARTADPGGDAPRPSPTSDRLVRSEARVREPDEAQAQRRREDAALIARIVAKDERAVEELYARYSGPLYSLAYQVTGADRFAQDVVQEVFVALWRDASRFDPTKGAPAPWLFSLARHKAIDLVRREANVRKRTADVDLELEEAGDDVDHEAWVRIRRDRVREAITELTPAQREALELAFFQGLTHVEVSERLGIPLGTAKTRIRSALLRLRDILGDSVSELPATNVAMGVDG
jgi:RNA polymerase sigma-70 factor (ECF subfamily)